MRGFHGLADLVEVAHGIYSSGSLLLRRPVLMCTKSGVTTGCHRNCSADRCLGNSCKRAFPGRGPVTWLWWGRLFPVPSTDGSFSASR